MARFDWTSGMRGALIADGKRLEAACFGPPPQDAPTLIMLHEGLGCLAMWRDTPQRLAAATGWGVFAYSRAGYGGSDPVALPRPLDYMTREATGALPAILDEIGFERGMLLGHSDGASIAAIHAGAVGDERVLGLVLMAPHFFTEPSGLQSIREAKRAYDEGDLRARLAKYHGDVDNAFRGWNDAWLDPAFRQWSIADTIDRWSVPVLALQGAQDQYGTLAQIREIEARANCQVYVEILDDCRHSPHLEQPDRTVSLVAGFARRLRGDKVVDAR